MKTIIVYLLIAMPNAGSYAPSVIAEYKDRYKCEQRAKEFEKNVSERIRNNVIAFCIEGEKFN